MVVQGLVQVPSSWIPLFFHPSLSAVSFHLSTVLCLYFNSFPFFVCLRRCIFSATITLFLSESFNLHSLFDFSNSGLHISNYCFMWRRHFALSSTISSHLWPGQWAHTIAHLPAVGISSPDRLCCVLITTWGQTADPRGSRPGWPNSNSTPGCLFLSDFFSPPLKGLTRGT